MKKFLIALIILIIAAGITWGQFYTNLNEKERKDLSEAYYLVGKQYQQTGEVSKGRQFEAMAYNIYPELEPSKITMHEYPTAAALLARYNFTVKLPEKKADAAEIIKSKFIRLVGSLIAEDSDSIVELLAGSVYISSLSEDVSQNEARKALSNLFSKINLLGLPPSSVYDVNSLRISQASSNISSIWGPTYILTIDAVKDFSNYIGFWTKHQAFYFYKPKDVWLIYSIGATPPPITWRPKSSISAAKKPAAAPGKIDIYSEIKDNFTKCISAFLDKNTEGAVRYIEDPLKILKLQTTITKKELETTFKGYFDNLDFSGITISSLIYPGSIFLEHSDKFKAQIAAPVYLLTVKTKIDLSDRIPFWTRYQEYYFKEDQGTWKIFAIF